MARPSIRLKIASAILGSRKKEFIPALNPLGGIGYPTGRIKRYDDKQSQIAALTSWVFAANSAISEPSAAVQYKLYRKKKDGDKEEITDPSDPAMEILELLDTPNLIHTGEQLRQLHFTYMNIVGESYVLMRGLNGEPFVPAKGKLPAALDIFPAHRVQFKLGKTYTESIVKLGQVEYPSVAFIRDINPDPANPYFGRSIVAAAADAIGLNQTAKEWNQSVFANNARPSLVFSTNESLTEEAYQRFKDQFVDEHTGTDNAGKPLLIEQGSVTPLMISQQDLEYLEGQKFTRDEILAMFKVSPGMVGQVENVNRANLEAGFYINAVTNVVPRVRQFVKQLNATLIKVYDPTIELDFVNPVPEDEAAKLEQAKAGVDKWLTKDEVRDMYGEKPLPDNLGEQIIVIGQGARTLESVIEGTAVDDPSSDVTNPSDPNADSDPADKQEPDKVDTEGKKSGPKQLARI